MFLYKNSWSHPLKYLKLCSLWRSLTNLFCWVLLGRFEILPCIAVTVYLLPAPEHPLITCSGQWTTAAEVRRQEDPPPPWQGSNLWKDKEHARATTAVVFLGNPRKNKERECYQPAEERKTYTSAKKSSLKTWYWFFGLQISCLTQGGKETCNVYQLSCLILICNEV